MKNFAENLIEYVENGDFDKLLEFKRDGERYGWCSGIVAQEIYDYIMKERDKPNIVINSPSQAEQVITFIEEQQRIFRLVANENLRLKRILENRKSQGEDK